MTKAVSQVLREAAIVKLLNLYPSYNNIVIKTFVPSKQYDF